MDGVGEWATTSVARGTGKELEVLREIHFPHSLGLLYSAATYYTGFKVNSGEYKVMGLAPYGSPQYKDLIMDQLIDVKPDGSFRLDQSYFDYCTGLKMTNNKFARLFGQPVRKANEPLTQFHMDVASSVQAVTEEIVPRMGRGLREEFGISNICLAGGVALNCVANGKLVLEKVFDGVWIQPAAGDAGGALGAALATRYINFEEKRHAPKGKDNMKGSYLGPNFEQSDIEARLKEVGGTFETLTDNALFTRTAQDLVDGKAIGWMQGRMEFGPRALETVR